MQKTWGDMRDDCFYNAISAILGCALGIYCGYNIHKQMYVGEKVEVVSDTITVVKVDTIREREVQYIEKRIVDSVYVGADNNVAIPIEQRHYAKDNLYDAWVSGYNPSLDSIFVYPKTEDRYITNTITKTTYKYPYAAFVSFGFKAFGGDIRPSVGLSIKTPRKWLYGAEMGIYNKNDIYFGFNIGYNLFNN